MNEQQWDIFYQHQIAMEIGQRETNRLLHNLNVQMSHSNAIASGLFKLLKGYGIHEDAYERAKVGMETETEVAQTLYELNEELIPKP